MGAMMMANEDVHRRALLVAAKVAFVTTAGCAPEPALQQAPMSVRTQPPGARQELPTPVRAPEPGACAMPSSATPSDAETRCCLDAAEGEMHKLGLHGRINGSGTTDPQAAPSVLGCCRTVLADLNRRPGNPMRNACCDVMNTFDGVCYPWGPPAPPAMPTAWA